MTYAEELDRQIQFTEAMIAMAEQRTYRFYFKEPSWVWNQARGDWDWLHITL